MVKKVWTSVCSGLPVHVCAVRTEPERAQNTKAFPYFSSIFGNKGSTSRPMKQITGVTTSTKCSLRSSDTRRLDRGGPWRGLERSKSLLKHERNMLGAWIGQRPCSEASSGWRGDPFVMAAPRFRIRGFATGWQRSRPELEKQRYSSYIQMTREMNRRGRWALADDEQAHTVELSPLLWPSCPMQFLKMRH